MPARRPQPGPCHVGLTPSVLHRGSSLWLVRRSLGSNLHPSRNSPESGLPVQPHRQSSDACLTQHATCRSPRPRSPVLAQGRGATPGSLSDSDFLRTHQTAALKSGPPQRFPHGWSEQLQTPQWLGDAMLCEKAITSSKQQMRAGPSPAGVHILSRKELVTGTRGRGLMDSRPQVLHLPSLAVHLPGSHSLPLPSSLARAEPLFVSLAP